MNCYGFRIGLKRFAPVHELAGALESVKIRTQVVFLSHPYDLHQFSKVRHYVVFDGGMFGIQ